MYTAEDARKSTESHLDEKIEVAVKDSDAGPHAAYLRVYLDDPWFRNIKEELEKRGFKNVQVPDICLKGDVYFEW